MVIVSSGLNEICLALVHLFESIPQLFSKPLQRLEFSQENFFLEIDKFIIHMMIGSNMDSSNNLSFRFYLVYFFGFRQLRG